MLRIWSIASSTSIDDAPAGSSGSPSSPFSSALPAKKRGVLAAWGRVYPHLNREITARSDARCAPDRYAHPVLPHKCLTSAYSPKLP